MIRSTATEDSSVKLMMRTTYAGFWIRFLAVLVDGLLFNIALFVVAFVIGLADPSNVETSTVVVVIISIIPHWLYFTVLESSTWQGTIGKRLFSIRVTDLSGRQISFARANGRYFGKFVSALILGMGYVIVAFTDRKQALHDTMASCLVLRTQSSVAPPDIEIPTPPSPPDLSTPR